MKLFEKICLIAIFLSIICIFSISSVTAVDIDGGSLNDLNDAIKTSDGDISLSGDIIGDSKDNYVLINKSVVIEGNNNTISLENVKINSVFVVNKDLTLKNMELTGGNHNTIFIVNSKSNLNLVNVTFSNFQIGKCLISNDGMLTVDNSTFKNIYLNNVSSIIYSNANTNVQINNSLFNGNNGRIIGTGGFAAVIDIYNSRFINNTDSNKNRDLIHIGPAYINLYSSEFINNNYYDGNIIGKDMGVIKIYGNLFVNNIAKFGIIYDDIGVGNNIISNNVFLGCSNDIPALNLDWPELTIMNNYFGSNNPVKEGIIKSKVDHVFNYITLGVNLQDDVDYNNLSILDKFNVSYYLVGNELDKLPEFTVGIGSQFHKVKSDISEVTFKEGLSNSISIMSIKSGEDRIILGSDLYNPIYSFDIINRYIDLKDYSMTINATNINYGNDSIVSIELKDADDNPISGSVELRLNGQYYGNITSEDGYGTLNISNLIVGNYKIIAFFKDTSYLYNDASNESVFTVSKANLDFNVSVDDIIEGQNAAVIINNIPIDLKYDLYILIKGVSDQGQSISVNGTSVTQTFGGLSAGLKTVVLYYQGDSNYNTYNKNFMFTVNPISNSEPENPINTTPTNPGADDNPVGPGGDGSNNGSLPVNPGADDNPVGPINPNPTTPNTNTSNPSVIPPSNPKDNTSTSPNNPIDNNIPSNNSTSDSQNSNDLDDYHSDENNGDNNLEPVNHDTRNSNEETSLNDLLIGSVNDVVASDNIQSDSKSTDASQAPQIDGKDNNVADDSSKAYEINKNIIQNINDNFNYIIIIIVILLILIFIGYYRRKKDDEEF